MAKESFSLVQPLVQTAKRLLLRPGTVMDVTEMTPSMRHIRVSIPSFQGASLPPAHHVRINVKPDGFLLRTYSIRRFDSQEGIIDLNMLLHGKGPGSQWVGALQEGDHVEVFGPKATFALLPDAPYYLFAGEETATVAISSMLEALPAQATVLGSLETTRPGEEVPYTGLHPLPWVYRHETSAVTSQALIEAVRSLSLPDAPGVAYLAGEALTCQAIRRYLIQEKHWPRTSIHVKPFWTPGKTGLD